MRLRFCLVTAVLLYSPIARAQVAEQDSLALVALYNATEGENWSDNTNWLSGPVSSWFGVTVSEGRVTALEMERNMLSGAIPLELCSLTELNNLDLYGNQLSGAVPAELGKLTNLTYLDLGYNRLTAAIPAELSSLVKLTYLSLGYNQLTGPIPAELGNLNDLEFLDLFDNRLAHTIPPELGNLANIERLFLGWNKLTGAIPVQLGDLSSLTSLALNSNQLTGTIPVELGKLTGLTRLNLDHNQLSGVIPKEFGDFTSMTHLGLSDNQLTGEIPPEIGAFTNLTILDLFSNRLTGEIPEELGELANLTRLDLYSNELTGEIPKELGNLDSLAVLNLSDNLLSGRVPEELASITGLRALGLSGNELTGPLPTKLEDLTNRAEQIETYLDTVDFVGSVLVAQKGETIFSSGYGMANYELLVPNTPETRFRIASGTKAFTAVAIHILQDRGLLRLEDTVGDHFPDAPEIWQPLTIYQLLTHTSGLITHSDFPENMKPERLPLNLDDALKPYFDQPLRFEPGAVWYYSNAGYNLLAKIIELISDQKYGEFIQEHILDPFGMQNTGVDRQQDVITNQASGYQINQNGVLTNAVEVYGEKAIGSGDMYSTVGDWAIWCRAVSARQLISQEAYEAMSKPGGYGLYNQSFEGRKMMHTGGGFRGFVADLMILPDQEICVSVLSNRPGSTPRNNDIARQLARIMIAR